MGEEERKVAESRRQVLRPLLLLTCHILVRNLRVILESAAYGGRPRPKGGERSRGRGGGAWGGSGEGEKLRPRGRAGG